MSNYRTVGLTDRRTIALSDYRTVGLSDYRIIGRTPLEQLEIAQKRLLKQILALPNSVADIAVYILTGILPIDAYPSSWTIQ